MYRYIVYCFCCFEKLFCSYLIPDVVLQVLLAALVGDLRQPGLLAGEGLVQVKQLQLGVIQVTELGRKHGSLAREQGHSTGPENDLIFFSPAVAARASQTGA